MTDVGHQRRSGDFESSSVLARQADISRRGSLSVVIGAGLGVLMAWYRVLDDLVQALYPMSKSALIPVMILWLGLGAGSKIASIFMGCLLPAVLSANNGARGVDRVLLWSARSLGASDRRLLWEVALPAAFPQIMTGLQVALPIAMITDIVAEMQMGGEGLGGDMIQAMRFADSPGVFSGIIAIAIAGYALVKAMEIIRRYLLVWHAEAEAG